MPHGMCPTCGQTYHFSVGDVKGWYDQFHPLVPFGSQVPGKCFFCWQELNPGDAVVIREFASAASSAHAKKVGVIKDVYIAKDDGSVFVV